MGVTYKLTDEVVQFIIKQRQDNPLFSCRQLAEAASEKFSLRLSKSSVHDVLKESGITTSRGRKPKDTFKIPPEKKKQIQANLSQIKLLPSPATEPEPVIVPPSVILSEGRIDRHSQLFAKDLNKISPEYEGAGNIFLKAALWDLGIFSEENIKESDWDYYLTYSKGIKIMLEGDKQIFIDLPLPIERCIREAADGLISNVKIFMVQKVSDEGLFKACMEAQPNHKIINISIVDEKDHNLLYFDNIVECERKYLLTNRVFVYNKYNLVKKRTASLFFSQISDTYNFMENLVNIRGFDTSNQNEITVTLITGDDYENKQVLQEAANKLNAMYLYDEKDRLLKVKIS